MSNFFEELKRRNVYKVATAYVVTAWLIIQVVNTIGPNLNFPDSVPALITRILIVGFPIALILAWLYELTPEGFKRTEGVQEDTSDNRKAGKKLNRVIIVSLALIVTLMLVERLFFRGNLIYMDQQLASIAVLPFANMSANEENEFFADGLAEQILDELAQLSGLQVTARTSSFKFKDQNEDVRKIAEQLTVNYILEGSVRFDEKNNRIKITTQLINANNGYHLWSETYEDDFDEIFAIQEDVSRKVASELRVKLLPQENNMLTSKMTENTEAYKLYIESRQYSMKRNDDDLVKAIELLKRALELDPNFAEAHAELSFLYGQQFFYGNLGKDERDELMKLHMDRALELAPKRPEVLRTKAMYNIRNQLDSSEAIADLRKAIALKPSYADAHYMLGNCLNWAGQPDLATKSLQRAVELDPYNRFYAAMLAQRYYYRYKEYDKAFAILDKIIEEDPSDYAARSKAVMVASQPYGDLVQAFKLIHEAGKKDPYAMGNLNYHGVFALDLDLVPVSEKYLKILQMRYPDNESHTFNNLSMLYVIKKDYSSWKEWIDFWASEKNLDASTLAENRADFNARLGNYKKAKEILLEEYPHLTRSRINIDSLTPGKASDWVFYIELLRFNEENEIADSLAQDLCDYYHMQIEKDTLMGISYKYDILTDCYYLSNDVPNFIKTLDERFFTVKNRFDVFSSMKAGWYERFEGIPEYDELEKRITEETHRMRAEVIEYLKEEGDWDPAWDKELGLE